ncbi:hypothetical protein X975_24708, partial [Stegodyphus mimosarum]
MTLKVLKSVETRTFLSLHDHIYDDEPVENHLIKAVIFQYLKIRMHHAVACYNESKQRENIRSRFTEFILFKHQ